jgi:endonuclease/exonuclease/phosphatase family metal-dependent hydrolase
MEIRALTWNLFHGRDFPPDPALRKRSSRLLGISTRNETHIQVNRDLAMEFTTVLRCAEWDVALLQECPPRWCGSLAAACGAEAHRVLTSRNSFPALRGLVARHLPDLIGANEGGSNLTLVRPAAGPIAERRKLTLRTGRPERRTMAFTRLAGGICVANLHASTADALAVPELEAAAQTAVDWAGDDPLIFGGDLNVRPRHADVYERLASRHDLRGPTAPGAIDHLLARGLEVLEPPRAWADEEREVSEDGLRLRLSDHAPVEARFGLQAPEAGTPRTAPA